ncbi:MAG: hypothetical protein ACRDY0_09620, partial [Acidimicrobiales bacterium]
PRPARRPRRGAPVKLLVRVDHDALLRGVALQGETCELVGYGPVPVSVVRDLAGTGDPFVAAILTRARQVTGVAHLGRRATAHQTSALEWLYPSCAAEGCATQAHLQIDHREDWAATHLTVFDHLDRLCAFHHGLKTRDSWALVAGSGKRPFVDPADPRHPRHHAAPAPSPAGPSDQRTSPAPGPTPPAPGPTPPAARPEHRPPPAARPPGPRQTDDRAPPGEAA